MVETSDCASVGGGRRAFVDNGKKHGVYIGGKHWNWLARQKRGASDAIRELVEEKMAAESRQA